MRILMCRPEFFDIEYEINPWMDKSKQVNQANALAQWDQLHQTIQSCGAKVDLVAGIKGLPDMVFTANAGLFYKNQIVLPHFKFKERQGELPYFENWFKQAGFKIANQITSETPYFEGAGDALLAGDKLFVGYGFRSDREFYEKADYLDQSKIVYCELTDPYFYHIDTCFCPLNDKLAIWYPPAFTKESQQRMRDNIELIDVIEYEAKRFACNAVVIDKHVILPSGCPTISAALEKRGFTTHPCDMNEYLKSGGACKCLTLRIS